MKAIISLLTLTLVTIELLGQIDNSIENFASLDEIQLISDGTSRYTEPKISPDGTKILTTRNLDTLIYIDLKTKKEVDILKGGRYYTYYWIDSNTIY